MLNKGFSAAAHHPIICWLSISQYICSQCMVNPICLPMQCGFRLSVSIQCYRKIHSQIGPNTTTIQSILRWLPDTMGGKWPSLRCASSERRETSGWQRRIAVCSSPDSISWSALSQTCSWHALQQGFYSRRLKTDSYRTLTARKPLIVHADTTKQLLFLYLRFQFHV